jgi:hypothetical protein
MNVVNLIGKFMQEIECDVNRSDFKTSVGKKIV